MKNVDEKMMKFFSKGLTKDCNFIFLYKITYLHKMAYTIEDATILCGVDYNNLFGGLTPTARFAIDVFTYEFSYCM